ncbi:hypothetical protein [Natranaeroarchaeum sulfidigenes]|uniref:Putative membrane protein n=1 Tax=Natranaeroarchaeum sulfidigenes TaxID=2784880 RepID=A0A897MYQ0_9EURY|nr:hypothetical protein [Natranaeroarchaeum sulfidigenes]QSG03246.1 putative membrane protein [Natranaeroarchaeum sulfidigenes]
MQLTEALRWTIYYRGIALVSFLLGLALAVTGVWFGFIELVMSQIPGQDGGGSIEITNIVLGSLLILFGFTVWQIGKTAAFYMTLTEATESEMADRFDSQTVKSEILEVLDDRLADIHADVETTRQQVGRLGVDEHAESLTTDLKDRADTTPEPDTNDDRPTPDQPTNTPPDNQ